MKGKREARSGREEFRNEMKRMSVAAKRSAEHRMSQDWNCIVAEVISMNQIGTAVIGAKIREKRQQEELTLKEFSELVGVSGPHISKIELGHEKPSDRLLQKIADVFECSIDEFRPIDKNRGKNHEGYSDPTATKALKNLEKKDEPVYIPGGVYEYENSNGFIDEVLIVASNEKMVSLLVVQQPEIEKTTPNCILLTEQKYGQQKRAVNPEQIMTRPAKYVKGYLYTVGKEDYARIKDALAAYFRIESGIKEVPVEVIKEVKVDEKAIEDLKIQHQLEMAKLESSIYKDICLKLLEK